MWERELELKHLVALRAVASERSFGRAAERLGYTQSAISQQIAALERERIRERILAGLERARAEGRHLGRPRAAVREGRIVTLRRKGLSIRQIARETGVSAMTIQRILKRREQAA